MENNKGMQNIRHLKQAGQDFEESANCWENASKSAEDFWNESITYTA